MATAGELRVLGALVGNAFALGYVVTVHDGEDMPVKCSTDPKAIADAVLSVCECTLIFRHGHDMRRVGVAFLVFGNADDGSELVADCSDNSLTLALVDAAVAQVC